MSYLSTDSIDHGLIKLANRSYGGFAYRAGTMENMWPTGNEDAQDPTKRFITQHNLALFWRRPGIYPRVGGFPIPLLDTFRPNQSGFWDRPPGNIRYDTQPIRHRKRNLLAGQLIQDEVDKLCLWAINDSSDHKILLQYNLQIERPFMDKQDKLLHIHPNSAEICEMKLPNEALELKAIDNGKEGVVFIRSKQVLELADPMQGIIHTVFKQPALSFIQIPYMPDEMAIVTNRGQLLWGRLEAPDSFSYIKTPQSLLEVCSTDCPRVLLSLSERELREVDIRQPAGCIGTLLYANSPICHGIDGLLSGKSYNNLSKRDKFWHVNSLDIQLETVLLTSTRQHILLDRRMPGECLVAMDHSDMDGADYCFTVPSFTDPATGAHIFSHYSLTQIRRPALSHWAICYHPKEGLWSSLGPKYELHNPRSIYHNLMNSNNHSIGFNPSDLPIHTRAIHYQPLHPDLPASSSKAFLFRQMEGGELWYENVFFHPLPKLRQNEPVDSLLQEKTDYEGDYEMNPITNGIFQEDCLQRVTIFLQKAEQLINESGELGENSSNGHMPSIYKDIDKQLLNDPTSEFKLLSADQLYVNEENLENPQNWDCDDFDPFSGVHQIRTVFQLGNDDDDDNGNDVEVNQDVMQQPIINGELIEERNLFTSCVDRIWERTSIIMQEKAERRGIDLIIVGPENAEEGMEEEEVEEEDDNGGDEEEEYTAKLEALKIEATGGVTEKPRKRRRMETAEWESEEEEEIGAGTSDRSKKIDEKLKRKPIDIEEMMEKEAHDEGRRGAKEEGDEGEGQDDYNFEVDLD